MSIGVFLVFLLAATFPALPSASRRAGAAQASTYKVKGLNGGAAADPDDPARNGQDYWERLVGTPSRLAGNTKKEGFLPESKYSLDTFDVGPFQGWLRNYSLVLHASDAGPAVRPPPPPLSFICGVWVCPVYKFIFIRNRKTASSTFLTAVKKFMLEQRLCNQTTRADASGGPPSNTCITRLEPAEYRSSAAGGGGGDVSDLRRMWREYTVITSTRNPWARAASGYQFTYDKWTRRDRAACAQPSFLQFCRDPFVMGTLSNLFGCVEGQREGVGQRHEGHWNFDFCHVEPAASCMTDEAGSLVVDFVIRYERLDADMQAAIKLINARRPAGLPAIMIPSTMKWRNKGTAAKTYDISSSDAAAFVYAPRYRECGAPCVNALADFYESDLRLFGWDRPGPPPAS